MRRNADDRLRDLERRTLAGDLSAALELYREQFRRIGPRETGTSPHTSECRSYTCTDQRYVAFTPHGEMVVLPVSDRMLFVTADRHNLRDELISDPWEVNGVPVFWTMHFFLDPAGFDVGWVPFNDQWGSSEAFDGWDEDRRAEHVQRAMSRWIPAYSTVYSYRVQGSRPVSEAANRRLLIQVTPVIAEWADLNSGVLRSAGLVWTNNRVEGIEKEIEGHRRHVDEAEARLAELIVEEVRLSHGRD